MPKEPTDATIRNTQAANKRLAQLKEEIRELKKRVRALEKQNERRK